MRGRSTVHLRSRHTATWVLLRPRPRNVRFLGHPEPEEGK